MDWKSVFTTAGNFWYKEEPSSCWSSCCSDNIDYKPIQQQKDSQLFTISSWTDYQDKKLKKLAIKFGFNWQRIAQKFPDKTAEEVEKRWKNKVDPKIKRTPWTTEQDHDLRRLFLRYGENWNAIALHIHGRPAPAIRKRYVQISKYWESPNRRANGAMNLDHHITEVSPQERTQQVEELTKQLESLQLVANETEHMIKILQSSMFEDSDFY